MKKIITSEIYHDGKYYCARCMDFDVFTQGKTIDETAKNLKEALMLYFEDNPDVLSVYDSSPSVFSMMDYNRFIFRKRNNIPKL